MRLRYTCSRPTAGLVAPAEAFQNPSFWGRRRRLWLRGRHLRVQADLAGLQLVRLLCYITSSRARTMRCR